jgi:pimeloyl-ACP methyl ester carboxylesterase
MILIPGYTASGDTWKTTVVKYQGAFQCHVLTLAGFAGVPAIPTPLLATVRAELAAYIRDQRLERPVIVGHSLGGTLALGLAADHPDLVGPLVVVDSLPFLAGAQMQVKTAEEAKPMIAGMKATMLAQTREQFDAFVKSGAATTFMVTKPSDLDAIKAWGLASDQRTSAEAMAELMGLDLRDDLARVTAPALVLGSWAGLHDQLGQYGITVTRDQITQTFSQQFAKLRKLHFAMAESARHFIMLDAPDWFFAQVDGFLADPERTVKTRGFDR